MASAGVSLREMETAKLLKGSAKPLDTKGSILIIQLGDIGDAVLTLPLIESVYQAFPGRPILLCVREHARDLMEDIPHVHQVLSVNKQKRTLKNEMIHQLGFIKALRKHRPAVAIELRTGTRGAVIAGLSGATTRIARYANDGTLWRNRLFTHLVRPTREYGQYAAAHHLNIVAPWGFRQKDPKPRIMAGARRRKRAEAIFRKARVPMNKPLVAVHPFSLWRYKEWQVSEMASLLDRIQGEHHLSVLVTGAPNERERARRLVEKCRIKPYNLTGETQIGDMPAVLLACALFIGVDTAALHIAAAVGIPTVGIFGPSSWINWAPRGGNHLIVKKGLACQPCSQKGCDGSESSRCLKELTTNEVYGVIRKMLGEIRLNKEAPGLSGRRRTP